MTFKFFNFRSQLSNSIFFRLNRTSNSTAGCWHISRNFSSYRNDHRTRFNNILGKTQRQKSMDVILYVSSVFIGAVGITYAAVPLYRLFCQVTGLGGTVQTDQNKFTPEKMVPRQKQSKRIKVSFNADTSSTMRWKFKPQQREVYVRPGETSLVFFTAENPTNEDIIGVSTYNVLPFKAGVYFNKIQCFCFEEQKLKAGEKVDLPVFFFIDPDFEDDPQMLDVGEITLSYAFFKSAPGSQYPALNMEKNNSSI